MSVASAPEAVTRLVGGRWEVGRSDCFGGLFNLATGRAIARVPLGTAADDDGAVASAARSAKATTAVRPAWTFTDGE